MSLLSIPETVTMSATPAFLKVRWLPFWRSNAQPSDTSRLIASLTFTQYSLEALNYSHSIVAGGLLVMSRTTRLMPGTSLTMRLEMRSRTS